MWVFSSCTFVFFVGVGGIQGIASLMNVKNATNSTKKKSVLKKLEKNSVFLPVSVTETLYLQDTNGSIAPNESWSPWAKIWAKMTQTRKKNIIGVLFAFFWFLCFPNFLMFEILFGFNTICMVFVSLFNDFFHNFNVFLVCLGIYWFFVLCKFFFPKFVCLHVLWLFVLYSFLN